jgi:molecular chaperone DnaK (HSP70)
VNQNEERTADSIGIEVHGGRAIVLIPAGSRIPVARAMTFTTVADGQRAVEVRVVRCGTAVSRRHHPRMGR